MIASLKRFSATAPQTRTSDMQGSPKNLIDVVQLLSHARDIETIADIVGDAARKITGADGATFVLRENDNCYYADENAIAPLWKGRRFPMNMCISGWVMQNGTSVRIKDIYADSRIPADAYRPTFVKSLAMVPIRKDSPIGAIGNYWATQREPTDDEMTLLQALADTTSVALENVDLYTKLQDKIAELEASNFELSCFASAAAHDLQEPLRIITKQVEQLQRAEQKSDERTLGHISLAAESVGRLQRLISDLVVHAQAGREQSFAQVDLSEVIKTVLDDLHVNLEETHAKVECGELPVITGNEQLLACLLRNLIDNAIKFSGAGNEPLIKIGGRQEGTEWLITVQDNGIGVQPQMASRVFGGVQPATDQPRLLTGPGLGLATCRKIVSLHHGRIWMEPAHIKGSIFCFMLPAKDN